MKRMVLALASAAWLARAAAAAEPVTVSDLAIEGQIDGENIVFTLTFTADVEARNSELTLVAGEVAYLDGDLPRRSELVRKDGGYALVFGRGGRQAVRFHFAARAAKSGEWRGAAFRVPAGSLRRLSVICDRDDLETDFQNALKVERDRTKDGKTRVTAFLGTGERMGVSWKPEVRKLEAELVATSDANTIATASVGALRINTVYTCRVIQGRLSELAFDLPEVNVTQVRGEDIREWRIDRAGKAKPRLVVVLGRPKEDVYRLQVESEMVLKQFPCAFDLPVMAPLGMIRASGFLLIGADSAIKLSVAKAGGLTQVEQAAFPAVGMPDARGGQAEQRARPTRNPFVYQYASTPYTLALAADDVVTTLTADSRVVVRMEDNELALDASIQVDVKDAPARELLIETGQDADWTVTGVTGENISEADTDVREAGGARVIFVPFRKAVTGPALVQVRMEKSLPAGAASFRAPRLRVRDAKTDRGYLVVAAEKGIRLKALKAEGLQEVFTGSAPMRVDGAQQAFRFRDPSWTLEVGVERSAGSVNSEVFHLVSLGEGVQYCSAAVTYHIGGAPIQEFRLRVPKEIESPQFTGADIESWTRSNDVCTVRIQSKIMGDFTLLVTYDRQFEYRGSDLSLGGIETLDTESEVGYIAIASSGSLRLSEAGPLPPSIIAIDRDEIPKAYAAPVTDPILRSYKYVRTPHVAAIRVEPFDTERLLGQIADYASFSTTLTRDGEAVTTAMYYIKNASRQYLVARLPKGAKLWSIRRVEDSGAKEDVLSQESEEGILIPVTRPRDPNSALRVEITYAETVGKLGFWRSGFRRIALRAALLPATHATVATWRVQPPEDFAVAGAGGNMIRSGKPPAGGLPGAVAQAFAMLAAVADGPCGRTMGRALAAGWSGTGPEEFTRTVNLSGEDPLELRLSVAPRWIGAAGSARGFAVALCAGLALAAAAAWLGRGAAWIAAGLTLAAYGVAESAAGRSALAVLIAVCVAGLAMTLGFRVARRALRAAAAGWRAHREARQREYLRRLELRLAMEKDIASAQAAPPPVPPPPPAPAGGAEPAAGYSRPAVLFALAAVCSALALVAAGVEGKTGEDECAAPPAVRSLDLTVEGPGTAAGAERSASVKALFEIEAREPLCLPFAASNAVLTAQDLGSRHLAVRRDPLGYLLDIGKAGKYRVSVTYQVYVREEAGTWSLAFALPDSMRNSATLRLPVPDMDIQSDTAVLFRASETDKTSEARAVFGPARSARFTWRPRVRKTGLEKAVYFCEVNTYGLMLPGLVDLTHVIRYQVAQGEIRETKLLIPAGMSVTAVRAPGLATWGYDPEKRVLDAILEKPVSGDFSLVVVTQVPCEGLPYKTRFGVPRVADASRQRGSVALAAPDSVQVRVGEGSGLSPMNVEDFSAEAAAAAQKPAATHGPATVRRAFRYHDGEAVQVAVETERVLPELRVEETSSLSIADERVVLSCALTLEVAKAGVFSADLLLPEGYDVETLSGADVSHWDEAAAAGGRTVTVHFNRHVADKAQINLVVARAGKGIDPRMTLPRIAVKDAQKHTGKLTVSAERGVRLMVDSQRGVDVRKASEEGIRQQGVFLFEILRPNWEVVVRTEVQEPLVKPEALQWVDLTEGMLQCRVFLRYEIENAGTKTFLLRAPGRGVTLSVTGANIARVHEADAEKGLWQVDLHNKVENRYAMTVSYQVPFAPEDRRVNILPLRAMGTEGQRGYLVVTCGGRVQVEPSAGVEGLKAEDQRNIPPVFGAGDLSNAILCYRTVREDYELNLSVVRHRSAGVLPASINKVRMTSVVSGSRKVLTRMALDMTVGNLRFLKLKLPHPADTLWTVLVNGKEVAVSRDGALHCVPLEEQEGEGQATTVELVYAGSADVSALLRKQRFEAPKFVDLPLGDIEWVMYVPPGFSYRGFEGTMEHREQPAPSVVSFDAGRYYEWNRKEREAALEKARQVLDAGNDMVESGQRMKAKKAFQQAMTYSQGQADLNEDARVQLRNLVKQQVKIGLVNRRDALRVSKNIAPEQQGEQLAGFQNGDYTQEYATSVEGRLSARDNDALEAVANKILDQQAAAAGVVTAIRVTMPEQGRPLAFRRPVQIDPKGDLTVVFRAGDGRWGRLWRALWPSAILFALLAVAIRPRGGRGTEGQA